MMAFSLTIPELLRQVRSAEIDADIYERCQQAERLCRQGEYNASLEHSKATVEAATRLGVALNIGVTFIYQAAIRHVVPRKDAHDQAPRDAETAVNWLKRNAHHALIAHLICARIYADDGNTRAAARHYRSAQTLAAQLIKFWHRRNKADQEKYYQEAQSAISAAMRDLQPPLMIDVKPTEPEEMEQVAEEPPTSEATSTSVEKSDESSPAFQLEYRNKSDQFTLNYYEISRVWINGQEYLVETVNPVDPKNPGLHLLPDQKYIAVPDPASDQPQQYVLVKEGAQPVEGQLVVNVDPVRLRAWADTDEATGDFQNMRIMGTVEARLRPTSSQETEPEDEKAVDESLLVSVDALMAQVYARPTPNPTLAKVYRKFLAYLRQAYNLEVIPIKPRETKFNPQAGHHLAGRTKNARPPDGVIVQVVRNGYTREGKVVREAHVIVNQK